MRVVYDPILRKIEKEIRMVSAKQPDRSGSSKIGQTNSWSPKNFAQYCSPYRQSSPIGRKPSVKIDTLDKTPTKIKKSATMSNDRMQIAEIFKRSPKASSEKVTYPRRSTDLKIHTEDVEEKIQKTIHLEVHARRMSEEQRKIWENKYGKSTGQKLLSFIEKQPVPYQAPLPKYALPKIVKDPSRQQMMLEQLRRLRAKNDNIQANIQKAIEVIENKMVDILSKPTTTESIEAFDEMEKEITNVLTLMKTPNSVKNREQLAKVEEGGENEVNKISEELFKRLDRILESPGVSSSGKSSKNSLHRQMKAKKKREAKVSNSPPPKSTDMSQVCFSSTSASGEEKFTITAISPKRPHKAPTVPSFLKNYLDSTENSTIPDQVSTITSELRKLENELKVESEHTDEQKLGPIKAQVVNLLLFEQTQQEPSPGGDQLNVLNELLENDLKPVDPSDEQSNSVGDLFSQGDFNIDCAAEKTGDDNNNKENIFEMVDTTEDGISEKDQIQIESYTSRSSLKPVVSTQTTETANKTVSTEQPQEINVGQRDQTVLNLNQSQQSTEATGPYFTPLTSPLNKTRLEQDVQKSSMVEKDDDQQIPGSPTPKEVKDVAIEDVQTIRNSTDKPEELVCSQSEDGVPNETGSVENKHSTSLNEDDTSETSDGRDDFYENVNKIISRVENVYNQLEQFEEEMLLEERKLNTSIPAAKIAVFSEDTPTVPQVEADAFLTPFMHAVKDLRKSVGDKPGSQNSSPRLQKSPSFYNVLSFLDNLADFKQEVAVELYSSRLCHYSYLMHIPQTFGHSFVLHQAEKTTSLPMVTTSVALKKSGCLKNPSSHSHVNTVASKSKQKVSFLLKKEEKSTQVTACPFHSVVRILSRQKMSSSETFASCQKDEQVSAYLDARENNSVDKMSQPEEEDVSFQSTLEVTDDISSDKTTERMQETVEHNLQENLEKNEEGVASNKNVVEIFRHINTAENRTIDDIEVKSELIESQNFPEVQEKEGIESLEGNLITDFANRPETVKVFYDNFKTEQSAIDSKILSGFYNETSILQVEKSLSRDVQLKKRESLEKLTKSLNSELLLAEILKDTSLFEPLKNLNSFIDSKLLKEVVERRQKIRMMRRKSAQSLVPSGESLKIDRVEESQISGDGQKENLLKGLYVFVYLLMFTALNLEYKCVQ